MKLVALDDNLKGLQSKLEGLGALETCQSPLLAGIDTPININALFGEANYSKMKAVYGRIFHVTDQNGYGKQFSESSIGIDSNEENRYTNIQKFPELISMLYGGTFTDDVGNTIFIGSARSPLARYAKDNGWYNWGQKTAIVGVKKFNESLEGAINNNFRVGTANDLFGGANLKFINKTKMNQPVLLWLDFDTSYKIMGMKIEDFARIVINITRIIALVVPGLGEAVQPYLALLELALQGVNHQVTTTLLKSVTSMVGLSVDDSTLQAGMNIYESYVNKDDQSLMKALNTASSDYLGIKTGIDNNDIDKIYNVKKTWEKNIKYKSNANKIQAFQDAELTHQFTSDTAKAIEFLNYELQKDSSGKSSTLLTKIATIASGRMKSKNDTKQNFAGLPTSSGFNNLHSVLLGNSNWQTPERTKLVFDIMSGARVSNNLLDMMLLEQIEERVRNSNSKDIYLPAGLSQEKQYCIAQSLRTRGYNIYFEGGMLTDTSETVVMPPKKSEVGNNDNYYLRG